MAKQAQKTEVATREERQPKPITVFKHQLETMTPEFAPMLPAHIPADRFARVVMSAVNREPKLLACDRRSLFNACMQAAEDGLLPDKREGAIVPYAGEAQWLPMVGGIRKLVRNSGLLADFNVQIVYEGDEFQFQLGDNPFIHHKPKPGPRRGVVACYSIATFKDGTKSRDVMFIEAIMQVARKSKAFEKGPWSDPVFMPEMAAKTVTKHHAKQLPTDKDLDRVMRRDDALYDFEARGKREHERPTIAGGTKAALEHFAGASKSGEKIAMPATASNSAADSGSAGPVSDNGQETNAHDAADIAQETSNSQETSAPPKTPDEYAAHFEGWLAKVPDAAAARNRWKAEQDLRLELKPQVEADQLKGWKAALDAKFGKAES